ncbi:MAG: hypothetical protein LC676_12530 [Loktanella sp.]|nr:hypothetical protein [Loktanella sp.]
MKPLFALSAVALLAACNADLRDLSQPETEETPAAAAAPTPQPVAMTAKERLVNAIESNGCTLTAENVQSVLTDATISSAELSNLAPQLEAEGRVRVSGSGAISVLTDTCSTQA